MSAIEFNKRKDHICVAPFSGLTINPTGSLVLCCNATHHPLGHISKVDSLQQFYNSEVMENIRLLHENKNIDRSICAHCYRDYAAGKHNMMTIFNKFWNWQERNFDLDWYDRKAGLDRPIRYLEYTCSNICNQTCASCSSWFSSKWRELELDFTPEQQHKFQKQPKPIVRLTDKDIDKIIDILPQLDFLTMKGGEPWADKNNVKILQRLLEVNPSCHVEIISNMQSISKSTWKMLESFDHTKTNLHLSASIDGVGKEYDWIRGGNFDQTVENIRRWCEVTKRPVQIIPFVSIFNFFSLDKIVDYFANKPYVKGVVITNLSYFPTYIKVQNLPKYLVDHQLNHYKHKFTVMEVYDNFYYEPLLRDFSDSQLNLPELKKGFEWIETINQIRGFDLLDLVPELKRIKEVL